MYNRDFHHERAFQLKRLAAWICVAFALLLVAGVVAFAFQTGLIPGIAGNSIHIPQTSASSACSTPGHSSGESTININSGGLNRSFLIHLPPAYGQEPLPVVFNYHGYDSSAAYQARYTNMGATANQEDFIVVFPQGALDNASPPKTSWNAGIGAYGPTGLADDVQFTRDMISYLQKNYCIDSHRIYVTGYSIGASMAYRVACTLTNQIAGLATVEAAFYHFDNGCNASRPLPFLDIHGLADQNAPYNGSESMDFLSIPKVLNLWFAVDQCDTTNKQTIFQQADVTGYKWASCANGTMVEQYIVSDGGHVWSGSSIDRPDLGYTTHTIDANVVVWNFFKQFKS